MTSISVAQLLVDCYSGELQKQVSAISELQDLKAYEAVPVLIMLTSSQEANLRMVSVEALGWLGECDRENVGRVLGNMLSDPNSLVRDEAVNSLTRLSCRTSLKTIQFLLVGDPDWVVRASSAEAVSNLSEVGDPETLQALDKALEDEIDVVRAYAISSIGIIGTSDFLPRLRMCKDSEENLHVKAEILVALYRLGDCEEILTFINLLSTADEFLLEVILNILEDLATRRIPEYFPNDIPHLRESLTIILNIHQSYSGQINEIMGLLDSLENLGNR
jgi:HEAT repeat protein